MSQIVSKCFKMILNDSKMYLGAILGLHISPKDANLAFGVAKTSRQTPRRQDACRFGPSR